MKKRLMSKSNPYGFEKGDKAICSTYTKTTRTQDYANAVGCEGEIGACVDDICEFFVPSRRDPRAKRYVVLYTDLVPVDAKNKDFKMLLRRPWDGKAR